LSSGAGWSLSAGVMIQKNIVAHSEISPFYDDEGGIADFLLSDDIFSF